MNGGADMAGKKIPTPAVMTELLTQKLLRLDNLDVSGALLHERSLQCKHVLFLQGKFAVDARHSLIASMPCVLNWIKQLQAMSNENNLKNGERNCFVS